NAELDKLAALPAESATPQPEVVVDNEPPPPRREAFWRAELAPVRSMTAVRLGDGVTLLLEATRQLDEHDLSALRAAAAPLLKLLQVRRVLDAGPLPDGRGS